MEADADAPPDPGGTSSPVAGAPPGGAGPPGGGRAGRNLPAAIGVGALLGGIALATLLTVKATFLLYMGAAIVIALRELDTALRTRGIRLPLIPVTLGGAAMLTSAYWAGSTGTTAAFSLTVLGVLGWRLAGGTAGYVRDVTAGIFAAAYIPLLASAVSAMLAVHDDGGRRVLVFVIVTVCSDIGGYAAGSLLGRHKLAPAISPKKTWEGLGGSAVACLAAGAITLPTMLDGQAWQGLILGAAIVAAAILGDLAESMVKRDLHIKDMGSVLPGHGGILDRIDSLLISAPVAWLLLTAFIR